MKLKHMQWCMLACSLIGSSAFSTVNAQSIKQDQIQNKALLAVKNTITGSTSTTGKKILQVMKAVGGRTKKEAYALNRTLESYSKEAWAHPFSWHTLYFVLLASHTTAPIRNAIANKLNWMAFGTYSKELTKFAQAELAEIDPVQAAKIRVYVINDQTPVCVAEGTTIVVSKGLIESAELVPTILYHGCIALEKNKQKFSPLPAIASYILPLATVVAAEKYGVESSAKKLGLFVSVGIASAIPTAIQIIQTKLIISPEEDARAKAFVNRKFKPFTIPTN